ncbi:MAG: alpha/beta hydrolase [Desulfobulbaceae bacterium]|nr:MAG: alpha/beta hydrolase [Desulfobulbaceae bacterium]
MKHRWMKIFLIPALFLMLAAAGCSPLRILNSSSREVSSATVSEVSYGAENRQQMDIYLPEQVRAGSPVVVFFYGGSWKRGQKENYAFVGHALSSKGYVVAIPDYRLYPEVVFPTFVEDGAQAVTWLSKNIEQATNGVVVMGHSAGAHIAALISLDQGYLEAQGQSISVVRGLIGLAGPYGFDPRKYRSTRPIFPETLPVEQAQPVNFACPSQAPILLLHGADDSVVITENSRVLSQRVSECGGDVNYFELDDIGHFAIVLGLADAFVGDEMIREPIERFLEALDQV